MRWIIFQVLLEIGILLRPEHVYVARTTVDGTFVSYMPLSGIH